MVILLKNPLIVINNDNDFSIAQIAFCSGKNDKWSSCTVGLSGNYKIFKDIIWEDAFYKQIIVWNRDSTNIASINTFGTPLNNDITMNIVAYYPFTIDTIISGYIKSRVTYRNVNLDFEFKYNTENQYDHSQQVNWVNNFDITISPLVLLAFYLLAPVILIFTLLFIIYILIMLVDIIQKIVNKVIAKQEKTYELGDKTIPVSLTGKRGLIT